ncbi:MAG TPA: acyl-[acyl-carrier-protein]--UDP-N-acetylglucosamine O-acyltransferase [Methylophaga sp.]|uniref:acyl-ACP--UDP-N-acetylglucosamine O-acyltransferase n=1 Tax=unclassified Methylophaga TaxID=2629249 RepID=UPI000C895970|nr:MULTISPECIES: acyl-ACP--UDP-N-acetylglucosamine O-acyltransferase [unclassified Methylophaga]MAP27072.1 acyl-[acyl-carrier-protein]--UDP-N-acetylglucosamine O-acyltransferase [Methylophaga sp.]HAD31319.1 acyl-[acyl-carrier-protein]--UDP-N-acetylglucosamine O-acyltransferase [Methylophaga sp.]HBX59710.1 acyl-[acyl-carrier-protein]--UDP-N-acetylglucosamine O-acyltransferase [Methylophaga sp.]HCO01181.1 acyl-[acyl-carrier-protein]--UDP-N-acetylglucosamine O-acyltransferase [Methylophaga sp.]
MIHQTALIDPGAKIADDVIIGAYSIIGANVEIASGTEIASHVVINGPTRIGRNNRIFQFSSIGEEPQDKKYHGEPTLLEIGDNNLIRESVTINRGTVQGGGVTRVGSNNWIMAYVHIAHDCIIGDDNIFANNASLAGHVIVDQHVILGGFTLVSQFNHLGSHSFSAMGSVISRNVPPYVLVSGHMAEPVGINVEGLRRRAFTDNQIRNIRQAYKLVYRSGLRMEEARERLHSIKQEAEELTIFMEFLDKQQGGIIR